MFYRVSENRIVVVKDRESVSLDDKTLQFIATPMLHWPETMFTYVPGRRVLFLCDFFGTHVALGLYDNEVEDLVVPAKRYFGEIMMLFRTAGQRTIEKVDGLAIDVIAPSHGPIYRNPERILEAYRGWMKGRTKKKAIVIGAPVVFGGIHPQAAYVAYLVKALKPPLKFALAVNSYGWSGGAIRTFTGNLSPKSHRVRWSAGNNRLTR